MPNGSGKAYRPKNHQGTIQQAQAIETVATLLGVSVSEARRHATRLPVVNLGERTHKYRMPDILTYRDRFTVQPKK